MKKYFALILISTFSLVSCGSLGSLFEEPSAAEVEYALQKLLNNSALKALTTLRDVNQQGFGGLLPEELQPIFSTLQATGAIKDIDKIENTLKNVSADVLSESSSLMKETISQLSFTDGVAVVLGGKDAATQVLRDAMYNSVKNRYSSKLEAELMKVEPEILNYWPIATSAYNLLSNSDKKVQGSMPDFLAERSVDLLFTSMGAAEADNRSNIERIGDSVVTKVFDYYRNRQQGREVIGWN